MAHTEQTWLDGAGVVLVAGICTVETGIPGFIASGVLLAVWYSLPTLYTAAFGQFLVVALFTDGIATKFLVPLELGLVAILVGPLLRYDRPRWRVLVTSIIAIGFGIGTIGIYRGSGKYWTAIGLIVTVFAVFAYGMHRYERAAFELVEATHE